MFFIGPIVTSPEGHFMPESLTSFSQLHSWFNKGITRNNLASHHCGYKSTSFEESLASRQISGSSCNLSLRHPLQYWETRQCRRVDSHVTTLGFDQRGVAKIGFRFVSSRGGNFCPPPKLPHMKCYIQGHKCKGGPRPPGWLSACHFP